MFERKNGYAQHVARSLINKQPLALTYTMEKASATVDSIFRGLNYQLENIAVDDDDDDVSEEDFRLNKDTSIGIDWKTLLMGELDNKQHAVAKAKAEAASIERRQLRKLKKMMEAERRAKEKVQKMAIRAYLKKKQLLKNFELSTIMSRKPLNSEKTSTVGVMENQRRRHLLTKMLSGDEFNSLERPAGMGKIKNRALEPVLMGELDNKQHAVAKAKAEAASIERRQLRKLKKMMEAERRAKEKVQKMAIRAYLKKKQLLKNFELSTIMSRKPLNSEKTSTVGVMENQRRRHLLTKMLSGDEFNSLERPAGMGKIKNRALEPVLLSQLPAHTKQISSQSDANWVEHQNVENLRNIKKIVQKQRIMKLKNSDFSHDPVKNIAMQKKKFGGPKILAHASLLRSYNANGLNP